MSNSVFLPRRTLFQFALLLGLACAGLPGGEEAPVQPATGKVVLRLSGLWGGNVLPGKEPKNIREKASRAVIDDFLKRFPYVSFSANTGLRVQGAAAESGLLMAMAGGSAGDILYVNFRSMDQFVRQGFLYPLDEYVLAWVRERRGLAPDAPLSLDELKPEWIDLHPQIWKVICRRGPDGRRHVYCLPYGAVVMALTYRKDLFREAGLDPAKPPQTWEELYACCEKLTDPLKGSYGFAIPTGAWQFVDFLWQGGSDVVVERDDGSWKAVFNDAHAVGTLRYLRKLFTARKSAVDPESGKTVVQEIARRTNDAGRDFDERRCAMVMNYTDELTLTNSVLPPEVLGLAALPAGPAGRANEINAPMWGINAQVSDPVRRGAAWEFIRHQASERAKRIKTEAYVAAGFANTVNPAWLEKFGFDEYLDEVPKEWRMANVEAFRWGHPEPYGKNCQTIYLELAQPLEEVLIDPHAAERAALEPGSAAYEADGRWIREVLDRSVAKTDAKLLGILPPETLERQRRLAWVAVLAIAAAFAFFVWRFFRAFQSGRAEGISRMAGASGWRYQATAWIFLFVAVASIGVWSYYPLFRGSLMAFQDFRVVGGSQWVGLDNFIEAWNQDDFWTGIRVTFLYVALSLGTGFFIPIFLALLLHEVPRGKVLFRVLYYLPAVISGLITMFLWKSFYDPSPFGLLNQLCAPLGGLAPKLILALIAGLALVLCSGVCHVVLEAVLKRAPPLATSFAAGLALTLAAGLYGREWLFSMWDKDPPFNWLNDPDTALFCVILPGIWAGAGPGCLIYLAALKAIPEEVYEAADLDGAGPFQKVWHIAFPNLKPLIIINFVGAFIGAFHAMQNIFVMTGSGPLKSTHALSLEIWMSAFLYLKYGYATAIAWILGAFLIGFTVWQLRILREMKFTTAKN